MILAIDGVDDLLECPVVVVHICNVNPEGILQGYRHFTAVQPDRDELRVILDPLHDSSIQFFMDPPAIDAVVREHNDKGGAGLQTLVEDFVHQAISREHFPTIDPRIYSVFPKPRCKVKHEALLVSMSMTDERSRYFCHFRQSFSTFARNNLRQFRHLRRDRHSSSPGLCVIVRRPLSSAIEAISTVTRNPCDKCASTAFWAGCQGPLQGFAATISKHPCDILVRSFLRETCVVAEATLDRCPVALVPEMVWLRVARP